MLKVLKTRKKNVNWALKILMNSYYFEEMILRDN